MPASMRAASSNRRAGRPAPIARDLSAVCLPRFLASASLSTGRVNPVFGSPFLNPTTRATDLANRSPDYMTDHGVMGN